MATIGLNVDFQLGSNGSPTALVDLSSKVSSVDFQREQDLPDVTAFNGNGARAFAAGLTQGSFSVEFFWDATVDEQLNNLVGYTTAVDFQYGPDGSTSGKPKYTGKCFLSSLGNPATVGDVKKFSGEFTITGAVTRGTFA
jgi:hypothetical protein